MDLRRRPARPPTSRRSTTTRGGDARISAALAVPHRLDDAVSVVLHACGRRCRPLRSIPTCAAILANCIPQPGTTATVDAMSDRLMYRLQYRNFGDHESLVVNHTVDADGADHAGIRWYEIRNPGIVAGIYQQGTYAPDPDHRWMGSAAMDSAGNIALGFSVSGPSTFPSIRYTGRRASDIKQYVLVTSSINIMSGCRCPGYGDRGSATRQRPRQLSCLHAAGALKLSERSVRRLGAVDSEPVTRGPILAESGGCRKLELLERGPETCPVPCQLPATFGRGTGVAVGATAGVGTVRTDSAVGPSSHAVWIAQAATIASQLHGRAFGVSKCRRTSFPPGQLWPCWRKAVIRAGSPA